MSKQCSSTHWFKEAVFCVTVECVQEVVCNKKINKYEISNKAAAMVEIWASTDAGSNTFQLTFVTRSRFWVEWVKDSLNNQLIYLLFPFFVSTWTHHQHNVSRAHRGTLRESRKSRKNKLGSKFQILEHLSSPQKRDSCRVFGSKSSDDLASWC